MHKILQKISLNKAVIYSLAKIFLAAELFYGNFLLGLVFLFLIIPIKNNQSRQCRKDMIKSLTGQFADALNSMAFAAEVGYSMENSVREALKDMTMMYGRESMIVCELEKIEHKISVNIPVEQAFAEFANETDSEDIQYFAHIFSLCKRSGGNLISVISNTAARIKKKVEVEEEISTIISGKKMEQKIMSIIPYGIIAYLRVTASEFVTSLYGNLIGICIMTVCLLVCVLADILAKKMLEIRI